MLEGSGIEVPPFAMYAQNLWEYWERTYSPDRRKDKQLARAIKGKTVMITGASSGIGRATALRVGAAGGRVILVARGVEKLEQTKLEIEDLGGKAFVHRCDLADISDIERMAKEVLQEHGRVDVLVNNAGRSIRRSIALSYDRFHDFERTMQLNYFGPVRLILSLLPIMRQTSPGRAQAAGTSSTSARSACRPTSRASRPTWRPRPRWTRSRAASPPRSSTTACT